MELISLMVNAVKKKKKNFELVVKSIFVTHLLTKVKLLHGLVKSIDFY